ncbi:energy transducer TonB [Rhodovarius crocodyli]|uniref:energy transducer TonB n=1 Tax=Rhodovarius crocodyli TaxID=1979269 RepID=UPI00197DB73F|nr:energy transducer TonB [Rhodovarius crocodyli]
MRQQEPPPPPPPEPVRREPPRPPEPRPRPRPQPRPAQPSAAPAAQPSPAPPSAATTAPTAAPAGQPSAPIGNPNAVPNWQGQLLARLQRYRRYPESSRFRREEGVVMVTFTMRRDGTVLDVRLARSSGHSELDAETLQLIRRAEPLPSPPPEVPGDPITLTAPVRFSLR